MNLFNNDTLKHTEDTSEEYNADKEFYLDLLMEQQEQM